MRKPDHVDIENAEPSTLLQLGAIGLFVASVIAFLIVLATPIPA